MKLDPQKMQVLLQMDDRTLWQQIRGIAAARGITLPEGTPPPGEMAKLRSLAGGCSQADMAEALRTLQNYRKKE